MQNINCLKITDSYKTSHIHGYHPKLEVLVSYLESRGGKFEKTIFFGLQYYLKLISGIQVTAEKINDAELFWNQHFGRTDVFNREAWEYILNEHGGKLPIKIKAVREGTLISTGNVLLTIENTDNKCGWLTNWLETLFLKVWYTITVATQSYNIKLCIEKHLEKSGTPNDVLFKCHDFSYRGTSCEEQAALGAAAHLISFCGTDTVAGIDMLQKYYNSGMCGFSIPATEHSVICSFGRDNEIDACKNWLNQYPNGVIACVSDTYDIYNACENIWGGVLKEQVMQRNGTLVIRPDSGDFFEVIPKVLDILYKKFGGTINDKGYKVLDSHVRVIQGDAMEPTTIDALYTHIIELGWSADNLAVGSGGGLLVKDLNRDTNKFATKACAAKIDGKWIDIYKDPITDPGKKSKRGLLKLIKLNGEYSTVRLEEYPMIPDELVTVFENGVLFNEITFDEVKKNAAL
jgi:nicotinamide phosphoribosyltransferase